MHSARMSRGNLTRSARHGGHCATLVGGSHARPGKLCGLSQFRRRLHLGRKNVARQFDITDNGGPEPELGPQVSNGQCDRLRSKRKTEKEKKTMICGCCGSNQVSVSRSGSRRIPGWLRAFVSVMRCRSCERQFIKFLPPLRSSRT